MKITLYTTHCPKCKVLETKLKSKGVSYDVMEDINKFETEGVRSIPTLKIDDKLLNFYEAVKYVNAL